eukprot:TRINITY_DN1551_c1_g1_i1.p6 TRINITY_DN1551_c1_g1~~TRINITY_DN1551_c1_g1_i1.p6  ORF type:complete len:146 (+),score=12.61 TRINITY_DN1551_c1_g1_i1:251-688(+)
MCIKSQLSNIEFKILKQFDLCRKLHFIVAQLIQNFRKAYFATFLNVLDQSVWAPPPPLRIQTPLKAQKESFLFKGTLCIENDTYNFIICIIFCAGALKCRKAFFSKIAHFLGGGLNEEIQQEFLSICKRMKQIMVCFGLERSNIL